MNSLATFVRRTVKPWRIYQMVLVVAFAVETTIMLVLPLVLPADCSAWCEALADALLLTGVLAPLFLLIFVVPLQRLAETRTHLLEWALTAQEEERKRIARDLHDGLGQSLTNMLVGLRAIEEVSAETGVREQAHELGCLGAEAHEDVRRLARGLRPTVLDDVGLIAALERFLDELHTTCHVETSLNSAELSQSRLPASVETAVYRIVQEATSNSVKHGKARHIGVSLRNRPDALEVEIGDDGRGFDPQAVLDECAAVKPFGLLSIQERAALLGGSASVDSRPGHGTVVTVRIPSRKSEVPGV